jgi:4'-phosphopantetheinyl transferase EntD
VLELLLPAGVAVAEAFADRPGETVFPGEEDLIAKAVDVRRREFVTGRRCAREALAALGHPAAPIRPGPGRDPQWPAGVVGSITHCAGYRAAAVAPDAVVAGIGIDAEPNAALPEGVARAVTVPDELPQLAALDRAHPEIHWGRLLFSAKESVYKAWYPLTGRWLGFEDARVTIDAVSRTFTAHLLAAGTRRDGGPPLTELTGRYATGSGLIVTATTVGGRYTAERVRVG